MHAAAATRARQARVSTGMGSAFGLLALGLLQASCSYDIDKIYKHQPGPEALPADLIDLWKPALLAECIECAKSECGNENDACRADEECVALTQCVAEATDPAAQNDCRAEHVAWLSEQIAERDIGGPYQQCVFLNKCSAACEARTQLSCARKYAWPTKLGGGTVKLHLRFVEGLIGRPQPGVRVRACQQEDPETCLPLTDWVTTDREGVVELEVGLALGSFSGYLELEGGMLYPTLLRFGWPIMAELVTNITVVSSGSIEPLLNSSTIDVDRDLGLLQMRMFGCNGVPTRDVGFSVDAAGPSTQTWYTAGTDISPDFSVDVTGDRGAGGIINVTPGARRISAETSGGVEVVRNLRVPVRKGTMTIVMVVPDDSTR
jgi:hypothetical protein